MSRNLLWIGVGLALLALILSAAASLGAGVHGIPELLPPGVMLLRVEQRGAGRTMLLGRLDVRQSQADIHRQLRTNNWLIRRANITPDEPDLLYVRRSLGGSMLETLLVSYSERDHRLVTLRYQRCIRRVTCSWR